MIFWATFGFGLVMLLVLFAFPRLAFTGALLMLLAKVGWLDFFNITPSSSAAEFSASLAVGVLTVVAVVVGAIIDWEDLRHNLDKIRHNLDQI